MKRSITSLLAALVVSLSLAACEEAGPFEDGLAAYNRKDYATAVRLWRPLAERGDTHAQTALGVMYTEGEGVPQDDGEAVKWFRKAAEQGYAKSQFSLGRVYALGKGVPQDDGEAVKWFRKAAEQGVAKAQNALGYMYDLGKGVPQSYVEAHKWFNLAAAQGNATAALRRDNVAKRMTPAQIAEAQRLAREWKPKK